MMTMMMTSTTTISSSSSIHHFSGRSCTTRSNNELRRRSKTNITINTKTNKMRNKISSRKKKRFYWLFFLRLIVYTNLHELFCQFISWTNWVNSGKFMDNCWISCQVMADMKKVYDNLIIINLYNYVNVPKFQWQLNANTKPNEWQW